MFPMKNSYPQTIGLLFLVRLFPEISIKSAPVRKRWTKHLSENLRTLGRQIEPRTSVVQQWDRIEVRVPTRSPEIRANIIDMLARTPGISNFVEVTPFPLESLHKVYEKVLEVWKTDLVGKRFCVRVKRSGAHDFSSTEAERYIGGGLNQHVETAGVDLKNPEVTVNVEIKDDIFFLVEQKHQGLGGFPVGTQESVLSLVSGGFDSTVASFQMIKRGLRTNYCFFNLGGSAHEVGVKEIAYFLWRKYGSTHRVRFITVPFEGVVNEIMEKVGPSNMGVVLKRMMLRAAEQVAQKGGIEALVTGEAVSQVSSQTIPNLAIIDKVTDMLVLRPLVATSKPDIIKQSREIGVEDFSANIPEYCGVISVKPSAKAKLSKVLEEEEKFDFAVLDAAVKQSQVQSIDKVMEHSQAVVDVDKVAVLPGDAVLLDIRHPDEVELRPLQLSGVDVLTVPFYRLSGEFDQLDKQQQYFLYCEKGVMSELHATHLRDAGHANVGVYRPE